MGNPARTITQAESITLIAVTVLAFFFIPSSLSSSIFGINIEELNATGPRIWVFIVTTCVVFAASAIVWGFSYQLHKLNALPRNRAQGPRLGDYCSHEYRVDRECTSPQGSRCDVRWKYRLRQFLRLIWQGHTIWAWKSGIAFSLLTSGRIGSIKSCSHHEKYTSWPGPEYGHGAPASLLRNVTRLRYDDVHHPCCYIELHLWSHTGSECQKLERGS